MPAPAAGVVVTHRSERTTLSDFGRVRRLSRDRFIGSARRRGEG
jgi:hypothetical protein